jgi:hypothetical protein
MGSGIPPKVFIQKKSVILDTFGDIGTFGDISTFGDMEKKIKFFVRK